MKIRSQDSINGMVMWTAEGRSKQELADGLSSGYIEVEGIRMQITSTQEPQQLAPDSFIQIVYVQPPTDGPSVKKLSNYVLSH